MKRSLLFFMFFGLCHVYSQSPCPANAGGFTRVVCEPDPPGYTGITLGPSSPNPSLNYSWSPSTGLSNSNIANPTASPSTSTVYTLTVTDGNGGCTTAQDMTFVRVSTSSPVFFVNDGHHTQDTVKGDIEYHYQFESTQHLTFTSCQDYGFLWYRDGYFLWDSINPSVTYSFTGLGQVAFNGNMHFGLYTVDENGTTCGTTFIPDVVAYGCDSPTDWPSTVATATCSTHFPVSISQKNLTNGVYDWQTEASSSPFYFNNFSSNTCDLNITGCSTVCTEGIYTLAKGLEGFGVHQFYKHVYMYYVTDALNSSYTGCMRPAGPKLEQLNTASIAETIKTKVYPNPTSNLVTISSKEAIDKIEIYDMKGMLVKKVAGMGAANITVSLLGFAKGMYSFRVITKSGAQYLKVVKQ